MKLTLAFIILAALSFAGPVLTITNPDISAIPGGAPAYWNFSLTYTDSDPNNTLVINSAFFDETTPIGVFTSIIDTLPLVWSPGETKTGQFGKYEVSASTTLGASSIGTFRIVYEIDSLTADPVSGELIVEPTGSVTAVEALPNAVPEPRLAIPLLVISGALFVLRRVRK